MAQLDFNQCCLLITPRSPFARRVRLAFLENGVQFEEKTVEILKPNPEYNTINPLGRVPTAILKDGTVLIDSNLILTAFYENRQSPLMPANPAARVRAYRWSAIATGLAEKIVEYFFESQRPQANRDPELLVEI